jgi:hypothetical protein
MSSETLLFTLTAKVDGRTTATKLAARVMIPGSELFPVYSLDAEAVAMRAVRGSTTAPAPRVLAWKTILRSSAVLDWELVGLGPAEIDLGWFTFINRMYTEGIGLDAPPGMPGIDETLTRYGSLAGRDSVNFRYSEVLAGTRLAVVMMRLAHMLMAKGNMAADDPMPMTNPATVVLSGLLGIAQTGSETGWVSGHC